MKLMLCFYGGESLETKMRGFARNNRAISPCKTDKQGIKVTRRKELQIWTILTKRKGEPKTLDDYLYPKMQINKHLESVPEDYIPNTQNLFMEA